MKIQRLAAAVLAAALLCAIPAAADDPVVTQSYLEQTYLPALKTEAEDLMISRIGMSSEQSFRKLAESAAIQNFEVAKQQWALGQSAQGKLTLKKGDVLTVLCGCRISVNFGTLATNSPLVDVSDGMASGTELQVEHLYMQPYEQAPQVTVQSETAELTVNGTLRIALADGTDYSSLADALAEMKLFRGRTRGYDLNSGATRAEGLTMFLRLLGLEAEALQCTEQIPFTDVPENHWAHPYVAYAYSLGLTNGTSETTFSPDSPVTAQHYLTFLMRALHYEEGTAFTWNTVLSDAAKQGMFTEAEIAALSTGAFLRSRMVYASYYSLFCTDQQSRSLLCDELFRRGSLTVTDLCNGIMLAKGERIR